MIMLLGFSAGARTAPTTVPTQAIGLQVAGISPTLRIDSEDVELSPFAVHAAHVLTSTLTHPRSTTFRVFLPAAPIYRSLPGTIGIDGTKSSHG